MILSANNTDFTVPGKNLKVSVSQNLSRKDISGQTSSTSTVTEGNKAKKISCALIIPKINPHDLEELNAVAEAVLENGDPQIYMVSHDLLNVLKIREVVFSDTLDSSESADLQAWEIKFSLTEKSSIAEKKENRELSTMIKAVDATGQIISAASSDNALQQVLDVTKKALE